MIFNRNFKLTVKTCFASLLIFILAIQFVSIVTNGIENEDNITPEINLILTDGLIINDSNIENYKSSGTGVIDDPFIIENLHIDTTDSLALKFDYVSSYYILRDSYFKGSTYGVYIFGGVTIGTASIINCTVEGALSIGGPNALYLNIHNNTLISRQGSSFRRGLKFTENIVISTSLYSGSLISINDEDNIISDNVFYGSFSSVNFNGISNSTIDNNVLHDTGFYISGDIITNISNNTFTNNSLNGKPFGFFYNRTDEIITGNTYSQIYLANSINTNITGYSFEGMNVGVQIQNCTDISISNVDLSGNDGFYIENTNNIRIENCILDGFNRGIDFEEVTGAIIQNNYLSDFRYGIEFTYVDDLQVNNNTILEVIEYGIYCVDSTNIVVMFNIITCYVESAESELAISISNSENVIIYYNVFISLGETTAPPADERSVINILWYSVSLEVGNHYSDWNGIGTYPLTGDVGSVDLYPFIDIDGDSLNESMEVLVYHTDPFSNDSDSDGITDGDEILGYGSDPLDEDTDSDGLLDGDEAFEHLTDPTNNDTDSDGLSDGEEINTYNTSPLSTDSDGDDLTDYEEVIEHLTDPTNNDTDSDGLNDGEEVIEYLTDPTNNDTDSDGFSDYDEVEAGTDPLDNTSFPIIPSDKSYLGLILGLTGGFLAIAGVTAFILIKKGIIKLPKRKKA